MRNATEARQGAPAGRVRYVLTIGIVVVALGFLVVLPADVGHDGGGQ